MVEYHIIPTFSYHRYNVINICKSNLTKNMTPSIRNKANDILFKGTYNKKQHLKIGYDYQLEVY